MIPKYRAWIKDKNEIRNVKSIWFEETYSFVGDIPPHVTVEGWCDIFPLDEIELMQGWTPEYQPVLTIYKGDIINIHWFYAAHHPETLGVYEEEMNLENIEVLEENEILGFYFEDDFMPLGFVPAHEESFEVVGNIYENPKILEVDSND